MAGQYYHNYVISEDGGAGPPTSVFDGAAYPPADRRSAQDIEKALAPVVAVQIPNVSFLRVITPQLA
jgi:hypothetical protein